MLVNEIKYKRLYNFLKRNGEKMKEFFEDFVEESNMKDGIRICPLCNSANYSNYRNMFKDDYEYRIVRCNNCGFVYVLNPKKNIPIPIDHVKSTNNQKGVIFKLKI